MSIRDRLLAALRRVQPDATAVVEVVHLRPQPPGELRCVRVVEGALSPHPLRVHEDGLRYRVDLGVDEPTRSRPATGFFLDQRENRRFVRSQVRSGDRVLNLFAHTGGFSVAALAGGASEVVSVDLSAAYLARLEENLGANGLPAGQARHRAVKQDARRFLEAASADERFDGIVLDPPTAASAGRRFWSVDKDFGELVAACFRRLAPGGWMLVCRNDRGPAGRTRKSVERALEGEGGFRIEPAPPAGDFPRLLPFPEGDSFEGITLHRLEKAD